MNSSFYEYDVAISYAGPDRPLAEKLAHLLQKRGLVVFFDLFEQEKIWGKHLYLYLAEVYEKKAQYCIVLISKDYRDRIWTRHELQSAFNRAVRERQEYILPIRIDDAEIDGLSSDLAYLSLNNISVEQIAEMMVNKIGLHRVTRADLPPQNQSLFSIFPDRPSALNALTKFLNEEQSQIWLVATTLKGILTDATDPFGQKLIEKCEQGVPIRIMVTDPETSEIRASQEMRAPGALRNEQLFGIKLIHQRLAKAQLRLFRIYPAYFGIMLGNAALINPYPYTREAFRSPSMIFMKTDKDYDPYVIYSRDIEELWMSAIPFVRTE